MRRLLVLRHAQSAWNADGRWQGWSDAQLSPFGEEQALQAGLTLAAAGLGPVMVACSDLARARRTAELIAAQVGYDGDLVVLPALREQDLGSWNGLTTAQIEQLWPAEIARRRAGHLERAPGGEAGTEFVERCLGALRSLAARVGEGQEAVVVTHGGVVMALEKATGVWEPHIRHPNLGGWWVEGRMGHGPRPVELVALERVDLSTAGTETVTRSA